MLSSVEIICAPRAQERVEAALTFLESLGRGGGGLVIAASQDAGDDLLRAFARKQGAYFAIHRLTLNRLAGLLAAPALADARLAPASGLTIQAIAARVVHKLKHSGRLSYFDAVIDRPGFPGALARTIAELRLNAITAEQLEPLEGGGPALGAVLAQFEAELAEARLTDRAAILGLALQALEAASPPRFAASPTLLLDVPIETMADRQLIAALSARSARVLATVAEGDVVTLAHLEAALGVKARAAPPLAASVSLGRLQAYLFSPTSPPELELDDSVTMVSAPGEMQECVEIGRRIQAEAKRGVPFDRIAVLLHAPARYQPYLEEALQRAGVPAYFARGARRPEPGGRALLALLLCAAEGLSARRFAEYLSLSELPDDVLERLAAGPPEETEFVAPDTEVAATALAWDLALEQPAPEPPPESADPEAVVEGTLLAPWRWEDLIVDASVIGGGERWQRRLAGIEAELVSRRESLEEDDARAATITRQLVDLGHLKAVALPLIGILEALPERAPWGEWLGRLRALAHLAIRDRDSVLAALAELDPMAPVGPVDLEEVRLVLAERLGWLESRPPGRRYGAIFVGPTARARGMSFEVVIVPGLAERLFPKKLTEDPILSDRMRARIGAGLAEQPQRVAAERLALRLAVGAGAKRVMFSYPRLDLDQGRPRVPSFYALEILRAAEGRLPGFDELSRRAACEHTIRLGWPGPADPSQAIDDAEFDLAVLDQLIDEDPQSTIGAAHYLLGANPHLARSLRARARRWRFGRWTRADGLVDPDEGELQALTRHRVGTRSYSATALEHYAACPYRFFLRTILRLEPREEIRRIDVIEPLTRGSLFHDVQFALLSELRDARILPLRRENLVEALERVDRALDRGEALYRDKLAPAIGRVWRDGIDSIRADLRQWLRRMAGDDWQPERFELAFGLPERDLKDPASRPEPVAVLKRLKLHGAIDLVERRRDGRLRVTDHKTGKARADKTLVVGGGRTLQPLLYALAAEELLGEPVEAGRLYYCTFSAGYQDRTVALNQDTRAVAEQVVGTIDEAVANGFLPAVPGERECAYCDYRLVCGPYEEARTRQKPGGGSPERGGASQRANPQAQRLAPLWNLRSLA